MRHAHLFSLVVLVLLSGDARALFAQRSGRAASSDRDCRSWNVRNTDRAILCGRIVDSVSGRGIGGGNARFVRTDSVEMNGMIETDGRFSMNAAGGFGTLTLRWSCRSSRVLVDTITLTPGTGLARTFLVAADAA